MSDLNNSLSKRLEAERAVAEIENQINERERKHTELEINLKDNEKIVQSSLQSIDYLEQLKQTKLQEAKEADQALSQTERKTLEILYNRQSKQRQKSKEINTC